MSDNIPHEIQMEIIKRVPDVKSFLRFRAVSKPWKSSIDSSEFITSYSARPTNRLLLRYEEAVDPREVKYVSFVDDVNEILTQQDFAPNVTDLVKQLEFSEVIGSSHGLLCLYCRKKRMFVLWNLSLKKSVGIASAHRSYLDPNDVGFIVCPVTSDPTIVDFSHPGQLHIFTLSSKRWNLFPCSNLPSETASRRSRQVVIDRCIYWATHKYNMNTSTLNYMILSFDLIAKEFRLVDIPHNICNTNPYCLSLSISMLRESLVLCIPNDYAEIPVCGVWKMEHDDSFTKLFTIETPGSTINNILGFRKNGELVLETQKEDEVFAAFEVYEPCSEHISNFGINGENGSFFMDSYKETLLLMDHSDGCVYPETN